MVCCLPTYQFCVLSALSLISALQLYSIVIPRNVRSYFSLIHSGFQHFFGFLFAVMTCQFVRTGLSSHPLSFFMLVFKAHHCPWQCFCSSLWSSHPEGHSLLLGIYSILVRLFQCVFYLTYWIFHFQHFSFVFLSLGWLQTLDPFLHCTDHFHQCCVLLRSLQESVSNLSSSNMSTILCLEFYLHRSYQGLLLCDQQFKGDMFSWSSHYLYFCTGTCTLGVRLFWVNMNMMVVFICCLCFVKTEICKKLNPLNFCAFITTYCKNYHFLNFWHARLK